MHQSQARKEDELQSNDHSPANYASRLEVVGQEDDPTGSQSQGYEISSPTEETAQEACPPAADYAWGDVEQTEKGEDSQGQQKKAQDFSLARVQAGITSFQVYPILPS